MRNFQFSNLNLLILLKINKFNSLKLNINLINKNNSRVFKSR